MPPPQEPGIAHQLTTKTLIGLFVILLLVLVAAGFVWHVVSQTEQTIASTASSGATSNSSASPAVNAIQNLAPDYMSGNYQAALEQQEAFESSTTVSQLDKDGYEAYNFGIAYRASGKLSDLLANIDSMKSDVIQNTALYTYVRVEGINEVATSYAWMGENPQVFAEIFKGPSYQNFLAPSDDPILSVRNMLQWSWSLYPTSMAGGWLAGLDMNYVLSNPNIPAATKNMYISEAESYLQASDALEANSPTAPERPEYVGYVFWEAFAYGALAHEVGGVYEQEYKTKYQNLISLLQNQNSVQNNQWLPYAQYFYASFLVLNDNDTTDAQTQLQNSVAFVKADPNPSEDEFANFIRNKKAQEAQSGMSSLEFNASELYAMAAISPTFKAFMASLK